MSNKLKHITGLYKNLPYSPEPEDIKFYIDDKNKKVINMPDLVKIFGEEKISKIEESIEKLMDEGVLSVVEEGKFKVEI